MAREYSKEARAEFRASLELLGPTTVFRTKCVFCDGEAYANGRSCPNGSDAHAERYRQAHHSEWCEDEARCDGGWVLTPAGEALEAIIAERVRDILSRV